MTAKNHSDNTSVLIPLPFVARYTYGVPRNMRLCPGDFVVVPLGNREVLGVVWDNKADKVPLEKLRYVRKKIEVRPLPEVSRRFIEWVSNYNIASEGAVLKMAMSVPDALKPVKPIIKYSLNTKLPKFRITKERERVMVVLKKGPPLTARDLARESGVGLQVVRGLSNLGALTGEELSQSTEYDVPDWRSKGPKLSEEQADIVDQICEQINAAKFIVSVLDGVPGSGKTEVYLEAICAVLSKGKQALVLLPEIALSAQWLERFKNRFHCEPVLWHSDLALSQRRTAWRAVLQGDAKVIVGARSALFLPFSDLGVIVIDEEHDGSFKQEEGVIYNARDMGVVRANLGNIPIILTSATPSLETVLNVQRGRYQRYNLSKRHGGAVMPEISIIDMRVQKVGVGKWLSPKLLTTLHETFQAGEQALLFLNRRGYAPLTLCQACGFRLNCSQCSTWLVEHRLTSRLHCHHCGFTAMIPSECSECGAKDKMTACGPGVERLAEEVRTTFPKILLKVTTSDTIFGPVRAAELVRQVEAREVDLLIGTQIISKGYHFPYLTLVGIVDADLGLAGGDLRASERTYQLLYQVSGRVGRAEHPGRVMIQTYMPDHPVIRAIGAGDRSNFLSAEAEDRESTGMPPFGQLAGIIVSSKDKNAVETAVRSLSRTAPGDETVETLGPAEAPLTILRGYHRRRFLLKAKKGQNLQSKIRHWLSSTPVPGNIRVQVDIDPYSFL